MLQKSLIGAAAVLGLVLAGSVASSQPASAGYACGAWNNWCGPRLGIYPGWGYGWYGQPHWKKSYSYRNWNKGHDWNRGYTKRHHHAYKGKKGQHYR
jgi:hypothetical protein